MLVLTPPAATASGWAAPDLSPRGAAEPALEAWAGRTLGDPHKVRCTLEVLGPHGAATSVLTLRLDTLGLGALDAVYAADVAGPTGDSAAPCELERRVLYAARRGGAGSVRLQHARPDDLAEGEITLFDLIELARAARGVLDSARAAEPGDFDALDRDSGGSIDLAELEARAVAAEAALAAAVAGASATAAEALRKAVLAFAGFGLPAAVPISATGDDEGATKGLAAQAAALAAAARARLDASARLRDAPAAADPGARAHQFCDRLAAVFGKGFLVLPRFTADAETAAAFAAARAAAPGALGAATAGALEGWFLGAARVRGPLARLAACLDTAETLGTGPGFSLRLAQLPAVPGEPWIGLPAGPDESVPAGRLSLVLQTAGADPDLTAPLAGLWLDEWVEVAAAAVETTAVTFPYDPPDAMAPQAVLLAVPPVADQDWTGETLLRVLQETLDLAKLRCIDPSLLSDASQYLPATFLAFNAEGGVVSSDLSRLTR